MRLVVWNCNMALHRKIDALRRLEPDIAVICECADPETLAGRGVGELDAGASVWGGTNRHKGVGVFAFNGYRVARSDPYFPYLKHILPVHVTGPERFNLLAVWAQNASGGVTRKNQSGPLRRALVRYRGFLDAAPSVVAGDCNNNAIWDRPGWRINHLPAVEALARLGLVSAYHETRGEAQGRETVPTLYWRDRRRDGPTYHIDYVFLPRDWLGRLRDCRVGGFDDWCGSGLSDHVPVSVDLAPPEDRRPAPDRRGAGDDR